VLRAVCLYCLHQRHGCPKPRIMQSYLVGGGDPSSMGQPIVAWLDLDNDGFLSSEEYSQVQCLWVLCWRCLSLVYTLPSWSLNYLPLSRTTLLFTSASCIVVFSPTH
jgi:hypothetical protein